mmetsp:Transcript_653/g.1491  ORF Transcript_653/g.1491 Transcript_653/m.1491 type:complete len:411 (-) Transcript_653:234-1466(-)
MHLRWPQLHIILALTLLTKTAGNLSDRTVASSAATMPPVSPEDASLVNSPLPDMPLLPITSKYTVRACRAMKVSSKDIFVCSYPKSGTTWTQNIVVRLLWEMSGSSNSTNDGTNNNPLPEDWHLSHSAPFYEVDQYWREKRLNSGCSTKKNQDDEPMERIPAQTPILRRNRSDNNSNSNDEYRVFNTHLLPHQLPKDAKCVYVVRDPLDVMVSFYYHLSNQAVEDGGFTGSFEDFFEGFLDGTIVYGKWQDHIEAWLGEDVGKNRNFLLLHYEDMKQDLAKETKRVARFLMDGDDDQSGPENDDDGYVDEIVSRVVPHCTFAAMKQEQKRYTPLTVSWKSDPKTGKPYDKFVRKGTVGDGRKFLLEVTSPSGPSSSALRDRWVSKDVPIARARWRKAGVEEEIINRYLRR